MLITYSGPYSDFFTKAFFDDFGDVDIDVVSASSTEIVLENLTTGALTTLTGTGFSLSPSASPLSGTITGMSFEKSGSIVATMANFSWGLVAFDNSLTEDGVMDLASLLSAQPITIDASGASTYFDMEEWAEASPLITSDMTITGTPFNDQLIGGAGNDTINPGANYGNDQLYGTAGNDAYDFINADDSSYYEINYAMLSAGITVNIDGAAETGSVSGADGTDTFLNLGNALTAGDGGFSVIGTTHDDVFNVTAAPGTWIVYGGGAGNDTFNLTVDESTRLFYNWDGEDGPDQGLVMNLATGVVSNDGLGYSDQVNVLGGAGRLEIRATDFNDSIIGSDRRESFILEQGNDTLDGGGGVDRVRYDRSGVDAVVVDLAAGTATGTWDGNGFTHLLSNIEYVRGSYFDDALLGSDGEDTLEGRVGNDTLSGRDGDDRLYGEGGNDNLSGGLGQDRLYGGDGNDTLIGNEGDDVLIGGESEADLRDVIYGGDGNDSIDGGYGNDELRGDNGDDTVSGGFGTDTVIGADGNDVLTGEAWSDMLYGGAGNDFLNGGFGYDRMNGGTGADRFFHLGIADHGSDWIQDYTAADGDVLVFGQGSATGDQFQVNFTETANAGVAGVEEAFIIYRPTGQIMWAL
ncbi:calcium-binding protein, partial [Thalassovita taeanensis]